MNASSTFGAIESANPDVRSGVLDSVRACSSYLYGSLSGTFYLTCLINSTFVVTEQTAFFVLCLILPSFCLPVAFFVLLVYDYAITISDEVSVLFVPLDLSSDFPLRHCR